MSLQPDPTRRRLLLASLALPVLPGCAPTLARVSTTGTQRDAQSLLSEAADAHGITAFDQLGDLSVSYAGHWRTLVGKLQPELIDAGFRGGSEERYLLREDLVGQTHLGASGVKHVVRRGAAAGQGDVRVWFNGEEAHDTTRRDAAALVVDGYALFLLGPMLLQSRWSATRSAILETGGAERVNVGGQSHACRVLRVNLTPGLGYSAADRMDLFIDQKERLMRRVRFTLNGLESTRGAIAEVDAFDHVTIGGIQWPTRFHEQLVRPLPLPVHDWRLTGIDLDRGLVSGEFGGTAFSGKAIAPARVLR